MWKTRKPLPRLDFFAIGGATFLSGTTYQNVDGLGKTPRCVALMSCWVEISRKIVDSVDLSYCDKPVENFAENDFTELKFLLNLEFSQPVNNFFNNRGKSRFFQAWQGFSAFFLSCFLTFFHSPLMEFRMS